MVFKRIYNHEKIIEYYNRGFTQIETGRQFGTTQPTVRAVLKKHNIPIRKFDKSGSNNPKWKGGIMFDKNRKLILSPEHPSPDFLKKYCYEYRLIMEKHLGRYLTKDEIIHHIDGDVTNNKIENLEVMTRGEHCRLHWYGVRTHEEYLKKKEEENK